MGNLSRFWEAGYGIKNCGKFLGIKIASNRA